MILGFKQQFKAPILAGTKIHSIRDDKSARWKTGNSIQMATGNQTKNYDCFKEAECLNVQDVFMSIVQGTVHISIDENEIYYYPEKDVFARNDGFENWVSFVDFFYPIIEDNSGEYSGKLIHWTPIQYMRHGKIEQL